MKIKTNVRAGSQTRKQGSSVDSTSTSVDSSTTTVVIYYPPVSRCTGI